MPAIALMRAAVPASVILAALIAPTASAAEPQATVRVAGKTFAVKVVDTPETRVRGLSGSDPLAKNRGMLFVFERDGAHAIWMKEMRFSLDIVWISRFGSVVHVEHNVHPDTYPRSFASRKPARYVLEIPAGAGAGIQVGDPIHFENVPHRAKSDSRSDSGLDSRLKGRRTAPESGEK